MYQRLCTRNGKILACTLSVLMLAQGSHAKAAMLLSPAPAFNDRVVRLKHAPRPEDRHWLVATALRATGGEAIAVTARLSDKAQLETLVAKMREAWGRIEILVCNAAISPHYGSLEQLTDEVFERMMVSSPPTSGTRTNDRFYAPQPDREPHSK